MIGGDEAAKVTGEHGFFASNTVPGGTYEGVDGDVTTRRDPELVSGRHTQCINARHGRGTRHTCGKHRKTEGSTHSARVRVIHRG